MVYKLENDNIWFPNPELADKDGLLAVGGDLSVERLLLAYQNGIFPWFSDETPILWYSPHERYVLFPNKVRITKSMKQVIRGKRMKVTVDQNFKEVINACATVNRGGEPGTGTWITDNMKSAYIQLHKQGYAHSFEVWQNQELVGGLYGMVINNVFCGESMFSRASNASKLALITLCKNTNSRMIDCQMHNAHLESMGCEFISREEYLRILNNG